MAGKGGPLVGPKQVKQFIVPYYKKFGTAAQSYGARLFSQDSDGDMNAVIDAFMESGLQGFYPCEPAPWNGYRKNFVKNMAISFILKVVLINMHF